jgi:glycosyltransferase involved in cell wall biosynthesis
LQDFGAILLNILFVHQNFPGQFRYSAAALAADTRNTVVALTINPPAYATPGVTIVRYPVKRKPAENVSPYLNDFQTKVLRAEACAAAALEVQKKGFRPDVIVVHPGWGEHMFLKDIWPDTRMLTFMEFFYSAEGQDTNFDPEFASDALRARIRTRAKNTNHLTALHATDWAYSPTQWQKSTLPEVYKPTTSVIFDGIDTDFIKPDAEAVFTLPDGRSVKVGDEVLTFVNRNLEPYRGFHIFMRALPAIQKARPNAITLIVGGDEVSYGSAPVADKPGSPAKPGSLERTWRDVMMAEVGDKLDMSRIAFLGRIPYPEYRKLIQVSRVHAYLTYPFVLSWSMLESLAAECLVVGSSTPPVKEALHHGHNGLLVDFFDVGGWSETIAQALAKPADYMPLRRQARVDVLAKYDLQSICLPRQIKLITALAEHSTTEELQAI